MTADGDGGGIWNSSTSASVVGSADGGTASWLHRLPPPRRRTPSNVVTFSNPDANALVWSSSPFAPQAAAAACFPPPKLPEVHGGQLFNVGQNGADEELTVDAVTPIVDRRSSKDATSSPVEKRIEAVVVWPTPAVFPFPRYMPISVPDSIVAGSDIEPTNILQLNRLLNDRRKSKLVSWTWRSDRRTGSTQSLITTNGR